MASRIYKTVDIDAAKFDAAVKRAGLSKADMSQEMGYGSSYLSNKLRKGKFSISDTKLIESMYDIKVSEYEAVPAMNSNTSGGPNPPVLDYTKLGEAIAANVPAPTELDFDALYTCIYSAVCDALKDSIVTTVPHMYSVDSSKSAEPVEDFTEEELMNEAI